MEKWNGKVEWERKKNEKKKQELQTLPVKPSHLSKICPKNLALVFASLLVAKLVHPVSVIQELELLPAVVRELPAEVKSPVVGKPPLLGR
jgi:hypothetical protein